MWFFIFVSNYYNVEYVLTFQMTRLQLNFDSVHDNDCYEGSWEFLKGCDGSSEGAQDNSKGYKLLNHFQV